MLFSFFLKKQERDLHIKFISLSVSLLSQKSCLKDKDNTEWKMT